MALHSSEQPADKPPYSCDLLIRNVHLATMNPAMDTADTQGTKPCPYGSVTAGAVTINKGMIDWVGPESRLPSRVKATRVIDGRQQWLTPGLIDCHTHLVYAGDRSREFEQRLEGVSYETIAQQGGGILSTVAATRAASLEALVDSARPRLEALISEGVTTVEIKSGYGLDTESELKILRAAGQLAEEYPVTITRTFLGAHALPPEYKNRPDAYIDRVCQEMLPAIAKEGLTDAVDVFCENIAFTTEQTENVFRAAKSLGLPVKLHAEQLSDSGGTELAVKYQALSVDHLEYLEERGISALKNSKTVATLLPGAFYYLRETRHPPIERLREEGIPIAIATDLNPGTSPLASIRLMMNMACTLFRLTPSEALAGCTRHAAQAVGLDNNLGMILPGMTADLILWPIDHPSTLAAGLTGHRPSLRIKNGKITHSSLKEPLKETTTNIWSGRTDHEHNPTAALRWHQKVQTYPKGDSGGMALVGFACDEGVRRNKGRPGAAKAPDSIRRALANLPWNRIDPIVDTGDITCDQTRGGMETAQSEYAARLTELLDSGHLPMGLGGGHEIAWGSYQGLIRHLEKASDSQGSESKTVKVGIINVDAHFDLRLPDNAGENTFSKNNAGVKKACEGSSGTPFWQIADYARSHGHHFSYCCLGVSESSNTRALFDRADKLGVLYHTDREMTLSNLVQLQNDLSQFMAEVDHLYLTIDMDAFPASIAPGVSAPAPRGVPLEVVEPLLDTIKNSGKLRLIDIAEYNPDYDQDGQTARLAARIIHRLAAQP